MLYLEKKQRFPGRVLAPMVLLLLSLGVVVACGPQIAASPSSTSTAVSWQQGSIPTMNIKAMDYSYNQPATVQAGLVDIHYMNNGGQPHQATIVRLNHGVTYDQFHSMLLKQGEAALNLSTPVVGPGAVLLGQSQDVVLNLSAGHYASVCFFRGQDNVSHYMRGMMQSFTVVGTSAPAQRLQAASTILLRDFSYVLPSTMKAGPTVVQVTNQGSQPHEVTLLRLVPGKRVQDVIAFYQKPAGQRPFTNAGGLTPLAPGSTAWLKLQLAPGSYLAVCLVTDPISHKRHVMLGMIGQFTVQ